MHTIQEAEVAGGRRRTDELGGKMKMVRIKRLRVKPHNCQKKKQKKKAFRKL